MKRKIVYVDMDDVLCDYVTERNKKLLENPDILYPQSQYGFFTNLEPIEGAIEGVNYLRTKFDVYILTRPSYKNPLCYTEKRIWIEKHFGLEFCKNLIIAYDKSLLRGDYLIDDVRWDDFEGKQLLFGSDEFKNWEKVKEYFI